MSENEPSRLESNRSWLERIGHVLAGEPESREELLEVFKSAAEREIIDPDAFKMIQGVLEVSRTQARDIMVPRSQMVVIAADAPLAELLPLILDSGHSRFPVIAEDRDDITGILLAKDLLNFAFNQEVPLKLKDICRPATFVPESKRLNVLLREFRINRNHMAIVVDEYGGVAGLITIEDILEEIVGEIEDEYDINDNANYVKNHKDNEFFVKALMPIADFNAHFNANFSDEAFDTIGGLVTHGFGHLPKPGESITIDDFIFTIQRTDKRRIRSLIVAPANKN